MLKLVHTARFCASRKHLISAFCLSRHASCGPAACNPKVAVVLSGSGVYDGTEIHEAAAILTHLTREGADPVMYAPNINQFHVIDHSKNLCAPGECRNVFVESARIARGNVCQLCELNACSAEAVVFPGGFGAAKNLSDFAVNGANCTVHPDVCRVIKDFHTSRKPIALCCIAPVLVARVLGNVKVTVGKSDDGSGCWPNGSAICALKTMGACVEEKEVFEITVDELNKIVTTPAFMYAKGKYCEIYDGVGLMIKRLMTMLK